MNNQTRVGLFALITLIIAVFGFYFLKGVNLFTTKNKYYAIFDHIDGLYKSNPVVVNGFKIGTVKDMYIDQKTGKIKVEIISEGNFQIPASSTASILSTDLVGSKTIAISLGGSSKMLDDGDTIRTVVQNDLMGKLNTAIDPLVLKINHTLTNLDSVLHGISGALGKQDPTSTIHKLNEALDNIKSITAQLDVTLKKGTLDKTLGNLASITGNIEKNNDGIKKIITNFADLTDTLKRADLAATVERARMAITEINILLKNINNGDGTISSLIKDKKVYNDIDGAILKLDALLADVKEHPYRYVNISVLGGQKRDEKYKAKVAAEQAKKATQKTTK